MFFQINSGIPLKLERLPEENGANLTPASQQQKLSPPTPFADTETGTNCCFSEEIGGGGGDAHFSGAHSGAHFSGGDAAHFSGAHSGAHFSGGDAAHFSGAHSGAHFSGAHFSGGDAPHFSSNRIPALVQNAPDHFSTEASIDIKPGETLWNKSCCESNIAPVI